MIKILSWSFVATVIKMISSLVITKLSSVILGPSGYALIGNLNNIISIFTGVSTAGVNNGVVRYTSELKGTKEFNVYIANALKLTFFALFINIAVMVLFSGYLSEITLLDRSYYYLFYFLSINILITTLVGFMLSILNGLQYYRKFFIFNIIINVVSAVYIIFLLYNFKIWGAYFGTVTLQLFSGFFLYFIVKASEISLKEIWSEKVDFAIVKKLLSYSVMFLFSTFALPSVQILVRNKIIHTLSLTDAGLWDGITKISGFYAGIVTTSLSFYLLPKLSELKKDSDVKAFLFSVYKPVVPILLLSIVLFIIFKQFIIYVILSPEFYPSQDLLPWQFLGDCFKILSWILAFQMLSNANVKTYLLTELAFSLCLYFSSLLLIPEFGIKGATYAYVISYILYFLIMVFIYRKMLFGKTI